METRIPLRHFLSNVTYMGWTVKIDSFKGRQDRRTAAGPNRNPAQYPQGAGRICKAAKPPTAALRVAVWKRGAAE